MKKNFFGFFGMFNRNFSTLIFLTTFLMLNLFIFYIPLEITTAIEVTPNTIVGENDVVILNYTLMVGSEQRDIQNGTIYVHDPVDPSVPTEIYEKYLDIHVPPNTGFFEGLLGMRARIKKNFELLFADGKAFNNASDVLFGEDLFYSIYIQEILLDASPPPKSLFDIPFFAEFLILISFLIIIIVFFRIRRFSASRNFFGTKNKCYLCESNAEVKCGNSGCKIPYCKSCFLKENKCIVCHSNTMKPLT